MRILLTTTSYKDTPGDHHARLEAQGFEIHRERGRLPESRMLELAGEFDAFLCGDDEITRAILDKSLPRLRVISKYGIGLDKIDVAACTEKKLPVLFTPGVNHTTVAEHTFCLLLALVRNLVDSANAVRNGAASPRPARLLLPCWHWRHARTRPPLLQRRWRPMSTTT